MASEELHRSRPDLSRRLAAEALGSAFLLAAIVGSGIMAERLFAGNAGSALLANSIATAAVLLALILTLGPVSGAHFNPAVTLADATQGGISWRDVPGYIAAQIVGAFAGAGVANVMFDLPVFFASFHERNGAGQLTGEFAATFGLLSVIWGCSRYRPGVTPFAVAAYILGAIWFTSSTSFANPAVTLARAVSDTFTGIRIHDVPGFIAVQILAAAAATLLFRWLTPPLSAGADAVVSGPPETVIDRPTGDSQTSGDPT